MLNSNILDLIIIASKIVLRGGNYSKHFVKIRGLTVEHFHSSAKMQSKNHKGGMCSTLQAKLI